MGAWGPGSLEAMALLLVVLARFLGVALSAPVFSARTFPLRLRLAVAALLALLVAPLLSGEASGSLVPRFETPLGAGLLLAGEVALGWVLGWVASILVWGAQLAGQLIARDSGLALGEVYDPSTGTRGSPLAQLLGVVATLAWLGLGGPQQLFVAARRSFDVVPPGRFPLSVESGLYVGGEVAGRIWWMGVQLALPALLVLLVLAFGLAVLARTAPELSFFAFGLPVRLVLGLTTTIVVLPFVPEVFGALIAFSDGATRTVLDLWGG